ncbi:MAG: hypothetical protein RL272_1138 [Candidatus Parcubacteria bacterium]|jgi:hypothetical protein
MPAANAAKIGEETMNDTEKNIAADEDGTEEEEEEEEEEEVDCECGTCTSCNAAIDEMYLSSIRRGKLRPFDPFA